MGGEGVNNSGGNINKHHLKNIIVKIIKGLSTIWAVYGAKNRTILIISWPRNESELFWQCKAPQIAISWQFMAPETAPFL